MKKESYNEKAKKIIKRMFKETLKENDKEKHKKIIDGVKNHTKKLEIAGIEEYNPNNLFTWKAVEYLLMKDFGKRFIKKIK